MTMKINIISVPVSVVTEVHVCLEKADGANFWSVSGSWRITSESFMENIKEVITDAKLRASYGVNGTQPSDYYGYLGVFGFGYNYNKGAGSAENVSKILI